MTYRQVKSVPGLEVTADAEFRYKDKPKKAIYSHTVTGRRATVRIMIMWGGNINMERAKQLNPDVTDLTLENAVEQALKSVCAARPRRSSPNCWARKATA